MKIGRILGTALTSSLLLIPTDKAQRISGGVIHNSKVSAQIKAKFVGGKINTADILNVSNSHISGKIINGNSINSSAKISGVSSR